MGEKLKRGGLRKIFAAAAAVAVVAVAGTLLAVSALHGGGGPSSAKTAAPHATTSVSTAAPSPSGGVEDPSASQPSSAPYQTNKSVIIDATITDVHPGVVGPPGTCSAGYATLSGGTVAQGIFSYHSKGEPVGGLQVSFVNNGSPSIAKAFSNAAKTGQKVTLTVVDKTCGLQAVVSPAGPQQR